ncbi:MAG TPA: hypothetical protein VFX85_07290 [Solirubrobacterales bacterium]|nr:hypothetical protein [Solirubrobacterales bacterium]
MSKRLMLLFAAVLALAAVGAGCGSSDDSTETVEETVTLTKAEFIKQGDQICKQAEEDSESEAEEFAEENDFTLEKASEEQIEEAIDEVLVPALDRQAEEIQALGAPEGDEEQVEAIIVALEDASATVADDPSQAFEGEPLKEATELAEDYGFKVCGE